jgi:hypothetical protein
MAERLTLDTNLLHELWKGRHKRHLVEQILTLDDVELAVTATVHEDIPHDPLAARLRELPELGITKTPRPGRVGACVVGMDMLGSQEFVDFQHQLEADWKRGQTPLPDKRDFDHLHAHLAKGRDVFLTWDKAVLSLADDLKAFLGVSVQSPEEYLERRGRAGYS